MEPVGWELLFQSSDASAPLCSAGCQPAGASKGEKQTGMAVAMCSCWCGAWAFHPTLGEENIYRQNIFGAELPVSAGRFGGWASCWCCWCCPELT